MRHVNFDTFREAFCAARNESPLVESMTSDATDVDGTFYVLTDDSRSGYAIRPDGELVLVFSLERGRGDLLVSRAVDDGAIRLDCFDGYLPSLYARYGFVESHREPNWTPGEPDVVFMVQP
jgi:outer membrane protein assembly factor BamB